MQARVLFGVLNWGLGHAARSVPFIRGYIRRGYEPVIASDGLALRWLRRRFPELPFEELPSYPVRYPSRGFLLPWMLLRNMPAARKLFRTEKQILEKLLLRYRPQMIHSDNRPAWGHPRVFSVYMTHQLHVPASPFSSLASAFHRRLYRSFHQILVPDYATGPGLSGKLGHGGPADPRLKYTGPVTRFPIRESGSGIDWLLLLSGPEIQRTLLEKQLLRYADMFEGKVVMVRGTDRIPRPDFPSHWEVFDLPPDNLLEEWVLAARRVVSRSGYTSLMDWFLLRKKAFLIPTPGQAEQIYLARHMARHHLFPYVDQKDLHRLDHLKHTRDFFRFESFLKQHQDYGQTLTRPLAPAHGTYPARASQRRGAY